MCVIFETREFFLSLNKMTLSLLPAYNFLQRPAIVDTTDENDPALRLTNLKSYDEDSRISGSAVAFLRIAHQAFQAILVSAHTL